MFGKFGQFGKMGGKSSVGEILTTILDTLGYAPQLVDGVWAFQDASGFGNNLQVKGSPVLNLSGSTCDIINHDAGMVIGTSDFTILFSIYISANSSIIVSKRAAADPTYFYVSYNSASKYFDGRIGNASAILTNQSTSVPTIELNTWYDVAITRTGTSATLWINGVNLKSIVSVPASIATTEKLAFGCWAYGSTKTSYTTGKSNHFIFDIRKWTDGEIINWHTNRLLPATAPTLAKIYCENSGDLAYDISGNARHGALTNGQWTTDEKQPFALTRGFSKPSTVVIPANWGKTADAASNTIEYPANSGLIEALSNTVVVPVNANLNEHIPAGEYTWAQLDVLVQTKYLIKTKTGSRITNLVVKKKMSNSLSNYTRNTSYNRNTAY